MVQLQKYPNTSLIVFFVPPQIVQNVAPAHFFSQVQHVVNTFKYINTFACLLLVCIKGKLALLLDKTGSVSQETRQNFIDSQNLYFNFHYQLFGIKTVHLSDKLSLTYPRLLPIEDTCIYIGIYVLKRLLNVRHILEKMCQCNAVSKSFQKNKQESVENFVAKRVLVESANQFSLE